jgi:hypothetical protein
MYRHSENNITHNPRGGMLVHAREGFSLRTGREACQKPQSDVCVAPPLSERETQRWLDIVARDYWYQAQMPITMAALGAAIGRESVLVTRGPANPFYGKVLERIARAIPDIEARRLVFPEPVRNSWVKKSKNQFDMFAGESEAPRAEAPKFLRFDAPERCPIIKRLSVSASWSLFARCASCGGNQFLPVAVHGVIESHIACYRCLPPTQHLTFGGREIKTSLIHREAKKYY